MTNEEKTTIVDQNNNVIPPQNDAEPNVIEATTLEPTTKVYGIKYKYMTREQAARYLSVSVSTLKDWACYKTRILPYYKVGKRCAYLKADLDKFIKSQIKGFPTLEKNKA